MFFCCFFSKCLGRIWNGGVGKSWEPYPVQTNFNLDLQHRLFWFVFSSFAALCVLYFATCSVINYCEPCRRLTGFAVRLAWFSFFLFFLGGGSNLNHLVFLFEIKAELFLLYRREPAWAWCLDGWNVHCKVRMTIMGWDSNMRLFTTATLPVLLIFRQLVCKNTRK